MSRVLKRQSYCGIFAVLALVLTFAIIGMFAVRTVSHAQSQPVEYSYTSVQIKSGDTISGIASDYLSRTEFTHSEYVDEIMRVNFLSSDKIMSGSYIIVPVIMDGI